MFPESACDPTQHADLAAVIMQEGLAYICLITSSMTLTRAKIEINIPRKRRGDCSQHDKAIKKFYDQIRQAIVRHVNFEGGCLFLCLTFMTLSSCQGYNDLYIFQL